MIKPRNCKFNTIVDSGWRAEGKVVIDFNKLGNCLLLRKSRVVRSEQECSTTIHVIGTKEWIYVYIFGGKCYINIRSNQVSLKQKNILGLCDNETIHKAIKRHYANYQALIYFLKLKEFNWNVKYFTSKSSQFSRYIKV